MSLLEGEFFPPKKKKKTRQSEPCKKSLRDVYLYSLFFILMFKAPFEWD